MIMAAGIMENDVGFVHGATWHGLRQYTVLDRPPTAEEARKVMCFEIEKEQLYRVFDSDRTYEPVDAWCIVRPDTNSVLVPHVGERFVATSNSFLFDYVNENLLAVFPELEIESVGTLWNGATTFINIMVGEFQVKGDKSPQISRLFYCNPLGMGAYKAGGHNIRIVCANTLGFAQGQAAANKTLLKIRHTSNAASKINGHLEEIAEFKMGLTRHVEELEFLTTKQFDSSAQIDKFLNAMFPVPVVKDDDSRRGVTIAKTKQESVKAIFESDQDLAGGVAHSAYGALQALTNWVDNKSPTRGGDDGSRWYDSINGQRAELKATAFKWLMANA
jgi:phage/plasmid-like protein (TIGR03299 family)